MQAELHQGMHLSVEATAQGVSVITSDGTHVGEAPAPWADLLNDCITHGRSYVAEVRAVAMDSCTVTIQNGTVDQ